MSNKRIMIELPALRRAQMTIRVVGDTKLVCHRFSEKAKQQMKDKQAKKAQKAREIRDPQADYEASLYPHPEGGYGFPARAFKACAVSACRNLNGMAMTEARQLFFIPVDLVKIEGEPRMREDYVRLNGRTTDLRYRGEFPAWSAEFPVVFNPDTISEEQLLNLFQHAGFSVGIGEGRCECKGALDWGLFHVEQGNEKGATDGEK